MSFKPKGANNQQSSGEDQRNFPTPKSGMRKARISLVVDLGVQEREDYEEKDEDTGEITYKPQKPAQMIAAAVDLVNDTVDYGGTIGKQHYRLLVNKVFKGDVQGIGFYAVPPKTPDGKTVEGKPWGFHPNSPLTRLANAIGKPEIITSLDVEDLLNGALMVEVDVKETEGKKLDKDGKPVIYKNVNAKQFTKLAFKEDEDGNETDEPVDVPALKNKARCITFDNATVEDIAWIRKDLLKKIKLATNYAGSQMQAAIEEYEASKPSSKAAEEQEDAQEEKPAAKPKTTAKPKPKPVPEPDLNDDLSDAPF